MKIAVLYGGISGEREVSLSSGKGIMEALAKNGHEVTGIDFHPDRLEEILALDVDLVFIGLHGRFGEDGRVQGLLDMLGIPYVGSGVLASSLAMDKSKAKQIFALNDIPQARSRVFRYDSVHQLEEMEAMVNKLFSVPFVVKPNKEGSTLGLTIVKDKKETREALLRAGESDNEILVEEFIKGRELTVAVKGRTGAEEALPVIEIIAKSGFYDYDAKYAPGGSEHIVPAEIDKQVTERVKELAVKAHQALGCETYSRVDFILTEEQIPYILEVNTLPGMTPTSLFPDAARAIGMSYEQMIEEFVTLAMNRLHS